jgi:hypothetical protein
MKMRPSIVGLIAATLLLAGVSASVSYGRDRSIAEPTVLELRLPGCVTTDPTADSRCRTFDFADDDGAHTGALTTFRNTVRDADGNVVGRQLAQCTGGRGTGEICTMVEVLKASETTVAGTIVLTNVNGLIAVTGGSGGYDNIRGDATLEPASGGFLLTIHLLP